MISEVEFEKLIQQVIEGEISRKQICAQYHISPRTLNARITQLANTNQELYQDFICKFPFKPKEITYVNFVELVKKIMKEEGNLESTINPYDISVRTFHRRLKKMGDSDVLDELTGLKEREIYDLYTKYRKNDLSLEDKIMIEEMRSGDIIIQGRAENRKNYLENLLQQYYEYINQGLSKAQAARNLGFHYEDMYKKEEELKRIKTEEETKQQMEDFKERMKVPNTPKLDLGKIGEKGTIERIKGE